MTVILQYVSEGGGAFEKGLEIIKDNLDKKICYVSYNKSCR